MYSLSHWFNQSKVVAPSLMIGVKVGPECRYATKNTLLREQLSLGLSSEKIPSITIQEVLKKG